MLFLESLRLFEVVQVVCVVFDVFGCFCLFWVVLVCVDPFIFMLDHFRFCMLCSVVLLDNGVLTLLSVSFKLGLFLVVQVDNGREGRSR